MSSANFDSLRQIQKALDAFAKARDWSRFHSPKNLAMALAAEAGEVLEHYQWRTEYESQHLSAAAQKEVALELADVLFYLVLLADKAGVDLAAAATEKMAINEKRFVPNSPESQL